MKVILFLYLFVMICFSSLGNAQDSSKDVIEFRNNLMHSLKYHLSAVAQIAKNKISYVEDAEAHADAIYKMLKQADHLFINDTGVGVGKSRALPSIWEDRNTFTNMMKDSAEKAALLYEASITKDVSLIASATGNLGKTCGNCHKKFRKKKN